MPSLSESLKPFAGSCTLTLTPELRKRAKALDIEVAGNTLSLFVFDWARVSKSLKEDMCEQAGQDDYALFALVNPDLDEEDLEAMVDAPHDGYLFQSEKGDRIYHGNGEMEVFTTDIAGFLANLDLEDEDEDEDEDDDEDEDEDDDDDD